MQFSGKLVIIAALAVTVLLASNIIAIKPVTLFELPFKLIGSNLCSWCRRPSSASRSGTSSVTF